jgi:uncharacterized paraquat-inducible protein A
VINNLLKICPECRYSLVGLPVDSNKKTTCPECGQHVIPTTIAQLRKHKTSEALSITKFIVLVITIMISPFILYLLIAIIAIFSSGFW